MGPNLPLSPMSSVSWITVMSYTLCPNLQSTSSSLDLGQCCALPPRSRITATTQGPGFKLLGAASLPQESQILTLWATHMQSWNRECICTPRPRGHIGLWNSESETLAPHCSEHLPLEPSVAAVVCKCCQTWHKLGPLHEISHCEENETSRTPKACDTEDINNLHRTQTGNFPEAGMCGKSCDGMIAGWRASFCHGLRLFNWSARYGYILTKHGHSNIKLGRRLYKEPVHVKALNLMTSVCQNLQKERKSIPGFPRKQTLRQK